MPQCCAVSAAQVLARYSLIAIPGLRRGRAEPRAQSQAIVEEGQYLHPRIVRCRMELPFVSNS
jgi:hypothetical protein